MNYDCLFNELPEWMKITIMVEALLFTIMMLAMVIVYGYCKYMAIKLQKQIDRNEKLMDEMLELTSPN